MPYYQVATDGVQSIREKKIIIAEDPLAAKT